MNITLADMDGYFARHLDSGYYQTLDNDTRFGALQIAQLDLQGEYGGILPSTPREIVLAAVGEQMIYLLKNHDVLSKTKNIISEHVEGLGSRTYSNTPLTQIAPRAKKLLELLKFNGVIPISRG